MSVEDNAPLVVLHDVVAVQTVTVLIEIIFAFGAREFLDRQHRFANFLRLGRTGLVARRGEQRDGIGGPRTLVIRRQLEGVAIGFAEGFRSLAGILGIIGTT